MSNNAVSGSIDIVITVNIYHHRRGADIQHLGDFLEHYISHDSLGREELQGSVDGLLFGAVSVLRIRIDLIEHEGKGIPQGRVSDADKPGISLVVLSEGLQVLVIGIQKDAGVALRQREDLTGDPSFLRQLAHILIHPVLEDGVLDGYCMDTPGVEHIAVLYSQLLNGGQDVLFLIHFPVGVYNKVYSVAVAGRSKASYYSSEEHTNFPCNRNSHHFCRPYRHRSEQRAGNYHTLLQVLCFHQIKAILVDPPLVLHGSDKHSAGAENDLLEFALPFGDPGDDLSYGVQLVVALLITPKNVNIAHLGESFGRNYMSIALGVNNCHGGLRMVTTHKEPHCLDAGNHRNCIGRCRKSVVRVGQNKVHIRALYNTNTFGTSNGIYIRVAVIQVFIGSHNAFGYCLGVYQLGLACVHIDELLVELTIGALHCVLCEVASNAWISLRRVAEPDTKTGIFSTNIN